MGDISRHRDIYFNTRQAIPPDLLAKARIPPSDLTYLELGNYLTDVSQFRDPVSYIFAKRKVWQEQVLPQAEGAKDLIRALSLLAGHATAAALAAAGRFKNAALSEALGALPALLVSNELLAGIADIDEWIDRMLGVPIERVKGDARRRTDEEFGYVGQFFQRFIEGITHLLFAQEVTHKVPGQWAQIDRIPEQSLATVYQDSFTQYYPHEHTDQPPYVWDASERHKEPKWYGVSRRQRSLTNPDGGIMNVVDKDYVQYLAEGLSKLEAQWRTFKPTDVDARRKALVRLGKVLHGVEDWFFHSNVVERIRLRSYTPAKRDTETSEVFVQRFVRNALKDEPGFMRAAHSEQVGLQRRLYRRLRFPVYDRGTRINTAGVASKKPSTLSLNLVYPAFPSQQDTAHTLLAALENLEDKLEGSNSNLNEIPPWLECVLRKFAENVEGGRLVEEKARARGISPTSLAGVTTDSGRAVMVDVLREWLPLVITLLYESERQRLVANVNPILWTNRANAASLPRGEPKAEEKNQLDRHKVALEPKRHADGITESNYERAIRFLGECGFLSTRGQAALKRAFEIDRESQKLNKRAPGAGGFLIQFALQLQEARDTSDDVTKKLNEFGSIFNATTDNGAFAEIVGSHSLMSKDTLEASPFFDDAKVLASVASLSVLHIFLDEVTRPAPESALDWQQILRHFIRFPVNAAGWERQATTFFREKGQIPAFADVPELGQLAKAARLPVTVVEERRKDTKAVQLEDEYIKLERHVSKYRYL